MTNMTDQDLEARLCTALRADAARAPAGSPLPFAVEASPWRARPARLRLAAPRWVRLAVPAALVVAMAAALSAGLSLSGGGPAPLSAPATAAAVLARAAAVSAAQPAPRDDQYVYTEAVGVGPATLQHGDRHMVKYTTWTWSSVDGRTGDLIHQKPCERVSGRPDSLGPWTCSERMSDAYVEFRLPDGSLEAIGGFPAAGIGGTSTSGTQAIGPYNLPPGIQLPRGAKVVPSVPRTYAAARALPASARQLAAYLNKLPHTRHREPVWDQLTTIAEEVPVLPPKVAAAVFTLAAQQPGITMKNVVDAAGRPGIGISQAGDFMHVELIFNPKTYQLDGIDTNSSNPMITPQSPVAGAISMAILRTAIVASEPSR